MTHEDFMEAALAEAHQGELIGEVPVGAVVVNADGQIIGRGYNQVINSCDPSAHAEIVALRAAASACSNYRLGGCQLYVTVEPCMMCAGTMVHARISTLIYGTVEPRAGVVHSNLGGLQQPFLNHHITVVAGVAQPRCQALIQAFFRKRRGTK